MPKKPCIKDHTANTQHKGLYDDSNQSIKKTPSFQMPKQAQM